MSQPIRPARLRHLYFRRRLMVALVLIGAPVGLIAGTHQAGASRDAASPVQYVVQPGDTMWSIAQRFGDDGSLTSYVDALVGMNGGASLAIGQVLVLPS